MRFPTSVLVALFALVGLVGVAAAQGIGEDDPHPDHSHIPTGEPGLGEYGTEGPITRDLLPAGMETLVSDEALELAQSPELAEARRAWDLESDFVHQVSYQLRFRPTTDFMSVSPQDLGDLLLEKPNNIGIVDMGLFLSDAEAAELARRDALGDRMPALVEAVTGDGVKTDQTAQPGANDPSFGGVWQDQLDGGAIVLAVTDRTGVDESSLNEVVGGAENLRVIEVPYSFQQVNEFRDQLLFEAEALGIRASVPIHSTGTGRTIVVQVPDPDGLPADFGSKVPADVYTVVEGTGVVEAGAPGSHHGSDVMPGVAVSIWRQGEPQGGACTWGFNGHTNSQSYAIVAGHCGLNDWNNHSGWTTDMYVGHPVIPSLLHTVEAADGWIHLLSGTGPQWPDFARLLGRDDLADDERFLSLMRSDQARAELVAIIDEVFPSRTLAEWEAALEGVGVRYGIVRDYESIAADQGLYDNGYLVRVEHPDGPRSVIGTPIRMSATPLRPGVVAPELGQHTEEVLLEHGFTWDDIESLRHDGAFD